ncbi:MAG: transmembrane anchor protein [Gammaproteobacteria bacterium]|nr:transmembrane anchor protein [Gammaproteobacteria bacterium]
MYNTNIPTEVELPSSKQLFVSTILAGLVAAVLLITVILPSEYGIDPTGIGLKLGLKQMGEIKMQLAEEAAQEETQQGKPEISTPVVGESPRPLAEIGTEVAVAEVAPTVKEEPLVNSESLSVTLEPGAAAEIKAAMKKQQVITYRWEVNTGHVNYDTHGDNESIKYHNYNKGKARTSHESQIVAAFDGSHGWFWRNRSNEVVTVTITISGDYDNLKQVL